tara:strand:+ start:597 stop:1040 length:444 start_codon:yes stop_codon:yes gene_type:complete
MTNQITVYCCNPNTSEYVGETIARQSPLDKEGVYLIPADATEKKPSFEEGKITKFINGVWVLENIPEPEPKPIPTTEEKKAAKKIELKAPRLAYLQSTDWQAAAFIKYGRPLDIGLPAKCQLANDEINAIEACTTLTALNAFSTTFE